MAYARLIRQNFFNEPTLSNYSINEKYLLIGLACTADDFGRLWNEPANIKSIIFPVDRDIDEDWIDETIDKFISDEILCIYEVKGINYIHFPLWFKPGWYLKQKIDNPSEFRDLPDCPICNTMMIKLNKRETSRAIKENLIEPNKNQKNTNKENITRERVIKELTKSSYTDHMVELYPLVSGIHYTDAIERYIIQVEGNDGWNNDHGHQFEAWIMSEQERLIKKENER
ncbi:hypothetical protein ACFL0J_08855 [Candidatus Neomarinimicrobiota bacterium]